MAETKKVYFIANRGSDSDDSNDDPVRRQRAHPYLRPQPIYPPHHRPAPPPVSTDLSPLNGSTPHHMLQTTRPPVSSDSSISPVVEDPPPSLPTPSLHIPPAPYSADLYPMVQSPSKPLSIPDLPFREDRPANESSPQPVAGRKERLFQTLKAPFGSRPQRTPADAPRRLRAVRFFFFLIFHL